MEITKSNIRRSLTKGDRMFASALALIKARQKKSPIILFGAGEGGLKMKRLLELHGIKTSFFVDNASVKWNTIASGIPILSPQMAAQVSDAFFVVSATPRISISAQLDRMGTAPYQNSLYGMYISMEKRPSFLKHLDALREVRSLLREKKSLHTFDTLVKQVFGLNPDFLLLNCDRNQYFPNPDFYLKKDETMVDAGAFIGDTVADALRYADKGFKAIHCFEPNAQNFARLQKFIQDESLEKKVFAHNRGLANRRDMMYFSGSGLGYHLTSSRDLSRETMPTTTIDEECGDTRLDFIKMDIEGAEPLALRGAEKVIKRDSPRLAVCIYHRPEHFWEIPLMIAKMAPHYDFYLRHHSMEHTETVWYAKKKR